MSEKGENFRKVEVYLKNLGSRSSTKYPTCNFSTSPSEPAGAEAATSSSPSCFFELNL